MTKHKRKHKKRGRASRKLSPVQRLARATTWLGQARYKEAIADFKLLLKAERRPEWEQQLMEAYRLYIDQLIAAGSEAAAVTAWKNAHNDTGLSLEHPRYIGLLLSIGRTAEALACYQRLWQQGSSHNLNELSARIAARALSVGDKILDALPPEDPVVTDFPVADKLLTAYCDGDDEQVSQLLRKIAFRSPYRDLRSCISVMLDLESNPDKAKESIKRIAESSPFYPLIKAAQLFYLDAGRLLARFNELSATKQSLVEEVRGWPASQRKLRNKLSALGMEPAPMALFQFCVQFRDLNPEYLRSVALNAVIHAGASRRSSLTLKRFQKYFGRLSVEEQLHAEALMVLQQPYADIEDIETSWNHYLRKLSDTPDVEPLRQALVQRFIVEKVSEYRGGLDRTAARNLRDALRLDPQDKKSYIELLTFYLEEKNLKEAREVLTEALKYYPDDIEILTMGIRVAVAGNAYKKAAGFAKKILAVDPINAQAQNLLLEAHLAHARKLAKGKKWHLVAKELGEARLWGSDPHSEAVIHLLEGIVASAESGKKAGAEKLRQAADLLGASVRAELMLRLEAGLLGQDENDLLEQAGMKGGSVVKDPGEVLEFTALVKKYQQQVGREKTIRVVKALEPALLKSARLSYSREEFEQLCEFWMNMELFKLLEAYADHARKTYPDYPLFDCYYIAAKPRPSVHDLDRLEEAQDLALESGDNALSVRIGRLLEVVGKRMDALGPFYDDGAGEDFLPDSGAFGGSFEATIILAAIDRLPIDRLIEGFAGGDMNKEELQELKATVGEEGLREFLREEAINILIEKGLLPSLDQRRTGSESKPVDEFLPFIPDLFE